MMQDKQFFEEFEQFCAERKEKILHSADEVAIRGTTYYVRADGCDENDGLSDATAWKTLQKVSQAELQEGDGVRFRRGDIFRGFLVAQQGVTYCAYGEGEKPRIYGWDKDLADSALWTCVDEEHHIWKLNEDILDSGTLVFNDGEAHSRKLIPTYTREGTFVCRDDESRPFDMAKEMTRDLDLFCRYEGEMETRPSKGEDFPVPKMNGESFGELYLRCDKGNPGEVFDSIEALPCRNMIQVGIKANVTLDNLCLRYAGAHAVGAGGGHVVGLHVTNCEIGWIGGVIQNYLGLDPNYPEGGRGTVTRFGNGVEIYGGCEDYRVENCWIYQIYDAGITHQITARSQRIMENIRYRGNLLEYCVYSIEYFLETIGETGSYMRDIVMEDNIMRMSGYGWGQQRHNYHTPAHIKGWSFDNKASDFIIRNNYFDRAGYRMLHTVAREEESCPVYDGNTYIQTLGGTIGKRGGNAAGEPEDRIFDENAAETIRTVFGDAHAKVYFA